MGQASSTVRRKLGESLSSIEKFDTPLAQATTSSIEALKAYTLGEEKLAREGEAAALVFYKRATELDPNFAMAYAMLGMRYNQTGQGYLAREAWKKAFELREHTSQRERFYIEWVNAASENIIPILEQWTKSYPRDLHARHNLAATYSHFGLFDKALVEAEGTYQLNPDFVYACTVLASLYERLNRLDEAKAVCKKAIERGFDSMLIHDSLYEIDFLQADKAGMEQEIEWARGKVMIELQARTDAYYGQLHKYRELWQQSFDSVQETKSRTALAAENRAVTEALIGDASQARRWATFAEKTRQSLSPMGSLDAPLAFALAGDTARAQLLVDQKNEAESLAARQSKFSRSPRGDRLGPWKSPGGNRVASHGEPRQNLGVLFAWSGPPTAKIGKASSCGISERP